MGVLFSLAMTMFAAHADLGRVEIADISCGLNDGVIDLRVGSHVRRFAIGFETCRNLLRELDPRERRAASFRIVRDPNAKILSFRPEEIVIGFADVGPL